MASLKARLQEILIRDKHISSDDLEVALKEQNKSGGELSKVLIKLKLIDEDVLTQVLSEGLGLPPINISRLKIDPEVIKIIPKAIVSKYQIMPISLMGDQLTLAMFRLVRMRRKYRMTSISAPINPHSSPITEKIKSVCRSGRKFK